MFFLLLGCALFAVQPANLLFAVTRSRYGVGWDRAFYLGQILGRQLQIKCLQRFRQLRASARANQGDNICSARNHPRDGRPAKRWHFLVAAIALNVFARAWFFS